MWQVLQCRRRRLEHRLANEVGMPLKYRGHRNSSCRFCGQYQRALAGKAYDGKKRFHCVASMKAAIPTSKLTRGSLLCCVETIGLALFLQQEHRVQQTQGAFAPVQHFNLLHIFFHVHARLLYPEISYTNTAYCRS